MSRRDLDEYVRRAYEAACRHGFHDKEMPMGHWLMLAITEAAEMVEADRNGRHAQVAMFKRESMTPQPKGNRHGHWRFCFETFIKDTVEDEMADVCIRLFDIAGMKNWRLSVGEDMRLENYYLELLRSRTFTENAYDLCRQMTLLYDLIQSDVEVVLYYVICWAKAEGVDIEWHISRKMEYNEQRARLHGKKY
ncbi:MAG: hypothetical protein J6Y33_03380 [Prevotella sp.]|nr:hypothetical protein [Prevotella sp.]